MYAGGESDLDFTISYPIIYPQNSVLFQTDDFFYATGLEGGGGVCPLNAHMICSFTNNPSSSSTHSSMQSTAATALLVLMERQETHPLTLSIRTPTSWDIRANFNVAHTSLPTSSQSAMAVRGILMFVRNDWLLTTSYRARRRPSYELPAETVHGVHEAWYARCFSSHRIR